MRRGGRLLGAVVALLAVAALVLWAASRLMWLTVDWNTPLRGRVAMTATGADTEPVLVPWALVALAAIAGVLATSGWGRRVVGTLVALAGAWALLRAVSGFAAPPADAVPAAARTAGRVADVSVHPLGPVVAVVGALLLLGAGAVTVLRAATLPRLGRRYDAPGSPPREAEGEAVAGTVNDHDMWTALDAGRDPTADPARDPAVDPTVDPAVEPGGSDGSGAATRSAGRDGPA